MGKIVLGALLGFGLLFAAIVLFGVSVMQNKNSASNSIADASGSNNEIAETSISVNALNLWSDYHANEVAADNRYKGKRLAVQGIVTSINKDFTDSIYLTFQTFNEFEQVHVNLNPQYQGIAAQLRIGTPLVANCVGGGMLLGSPMLNDCSIRNLEPVRPVQTLANVAAQAEIPDDEDSTKVYKVGEGIAPPQLLRSVEAQYTELARTNRREGTVLVSLVVDKNGDPQNIELVRSLGMGLDDNAIEAVKQYKFSPATEQRTGKPVAVQLTVEVNFTLLHQ